MDEQTSLAPMISAKKLLRESWQIYRSKYSLLFEIMAVPAILMLISFLLGPFSGGLIRLVSYFVSLLAQAAIILIILNRRNSEATFNLKSAYLNAWSKFWPYLWVVILVGFIVCGAFFLLILPGVILSVWLSFSALILLAGGEKGMMAIIKSREMVRNYFWPVFGRLFLIGLVAWLVSFVIALILGLVGRGALSGLEMAITMVISLPFVSIYQVLLFENLKEIKTIATPNPRLARNFLLVGFLGWIVGAVVLVIAFLFILQGLFGVTDSTKMKLPIVPNTIVSTTSVPTDLPASTETE